VKTTRVLVIAIALGGTAGCPADDSCGPGDAPGDGLTVTGTGVSLRYHDLSASPNNDCPDPSAPEGVVPVTIAGVQVNGSDAINLCIPRPDLLESDTPLALNQDPHGAAIEIVDLNAAADGCTFADNPTMAPTGTGHAEGICDNGSDPNGFALLVNAQVFVDRTCGALVETLQLNLAGTVSVAAP
jgi:hypothetical protein